eukprot:6416877-Alexandrium_andersonii.AAC.1
MASRRGRLVFASADAACDCWRGRSAFCSACFALHLCAWLGRLPCPAWSTCSSADASFGLAD